MRRPSSSVPLLLVLVALVLVGAGPAAAALPPAPRYVLTDLGPAGGTASFALGLGRGGSAVGTSRTGVGPRPQVATAWDAGTPRVLGTLPDGTFSRAFAVDARGVAVGEAFTAPPAETSRAVRFVDGRVEDLGVLGAATGAVANDVNDRGLVVGSSGGQPVVWRGAGAEALPPLVDGGTGRATGVNGRGQVVGQMRSRSTTADGAPVAHAFLAVPRGRGWYTTDLGALSGTSTSTAYDVGDRGEVVGESGLPGTPGTYRAVVWRGAAPVDLGTLGALRHSRANAVNSRGDIVGHATGFYGFPTLDGRAVLWRDGDVVDLTTAATEATGWVLRSAEDIDAAGRIVGYGSVAGQTRGFLLMPAAGGR